MRIVTKTASRQSTYDLADIIDAYVPKNKHHGHLTKNKISMAAAKNVWESSHQVHDCLVDAFEAVEVVQPSEALLLCKTSQSWAQWMDNTFVDPMVASEVIEVLSPKLQEEVVAQKCELQQNHLKANENDKALQDLLKLKYRNEAPKSEFAKLRKNVLDGTYSSISRKEKFQTMQEKVDASNIKLKTAKEKKVALRLHVDVMQLTLSFAKSALENKTIDLVRFEFKFDSLRNYTNPRRQCVWRVCFPLTINIRARYNAYSTILWICNKQWTSKQLKIWQRI